MDGREDNGRMLVRPRWDDDSVITCKLENGFHTMRSRNSSIKIKKEVRKVCKKH